MAVAPWVVPDALWKRIEPLLPKPVVPVAELVDRRVVKETALRDLRRVDHLITYVYLPPLEVNELEFSMPESVALLYMMD